MKLKTLLINTALFVSSQAGIALVAVADPNVRVCDTTPTPAPILSINHFDCSLPNSVYQSVNRTYVDQHGNRLMKTVPGFRLTNCDNSGACVHKGEFMGNAPAGLYGVTTGWYLDTDKSGGVVAYKEGTGPGYGGEYYSPQAQSSAVRQSDTEQCQNDWIKAYREEAGADAMVGSAQLSEWEAWCIKGKRP